MNTKIPTTSNKNYRDSAGRSTRSLYYIYFIFLINMHSGPMFIKITSCIPFREWHSGGYYRCHELECRCCFFFILRLSNHIVWCTLLLFVCLPCILLCGCNTEYLNWTVFHKIAVECPIEQRDHNIFLNRKQRKLKASLMLSSILQWSTTWKHITWL